MGGIVSLVATISVVAIGLVALVFSSRVRLVLSETFKHPLKTTEITVDERGNVVEIKVSDSTKLSDRATAENQQPGKD